MIPLNPDQMDMLKWLSIADDLTIRSRDDERSAQLLQFAGLAYFRPCRVPRSSIRGYASITAAGVDYLINSTAPMQIGMDFATGKDLCVVQTFVDGVLVSEKEHG